MRKGWFGVAALTVSVLVVPVGAVFASVNDFYFSDYKVEYTLSRDDAGISRLSVIEELTAEFPNFNQNHGITRGVPTTNLDGENRVATKDSLNFRAFRNDVPEPIAKTDARADSVTFYLGDANAYVQGTQVYRLEYVFERVVTQFDGYQELYWDTNGTGWPQRFERLSGVVNLDDSVPSGAVLDAWCYVGRAGSNNQGDCTIEVEDRRVVFSALRQLEAYENLTFTLMIKDGTFVVPPPPEPQVSNFLSYFLGCIVAVPVLLFLIAVIRYIAIVIPLKQKYLSIIPPQYEPPKEVSMSVAANVYRPGYKKIAATALVDLAVRDKIRIIVEPGKVFKWQKNYSFEITDANHFYDLAEEEEKLLEIFTDGETSQGHVARITGLSPSNERARLYRRYLTLLKTKTYKSERTDKKLRRGTIFMFVLFGMIAFFVMVPYLIEWGLLYLLENNIEFALPSSGLAIAAMYAFFTLPITLTIVTIINKKRGRYAHLTERSWEVLAHLKGMRRFIALAEAERIKFFQSPENAEKIDIDDRRKIVKLYERLLPYAMLFGLEQKWAQELKTNFAPELSSDMDSLALTSLHVAAISSAISSSTSYVSSGGGGSSGGGWSSSSSSSGSSGGGSSGGGGGGGGGGGW